MLSVYRMYEGIRHEGINYGRPELFVVLGTGSDYPSVDTLAEDIFRFTRHQWICILGDDTARIGMGSLVKILSKLGLYIELEADGKSATPGWFISADRWVVDYTEDSPFNYFTLRPQDMIRFKYLGSTEDISRGLKVVEASLGMKYLKVPTVSKDEYKEIFDLVTKNEDVRIYVS